MSIRKRITTVGKRKKNTDYLATDSALGLKETDSGPGFVKRHRVALIAFISLIAIIALTVIGFVFAINHSLSGIKRVPITINESARPQKNDKDKALNILMLGADAGTARNGAGTSILRDAASSNWPAGMYRSDATMLVHITADKKKAYIVSIPRDSYVKVYDSTGTARDDTKINAALSLYGPSGALSTVENFTGLRIDHLAMVDWDGFEGITNTIGGVTVTIPGRGEVKLDGAAALTYVRERHHLPNGDFDRVKRQQNFLRAMARKLREQGTLSNPIRMTKTVNAMSKSVAVDDGWSNGDIRSLATKLRSIKPRNLIFMTIPTKGTASDPIAGSIVVVDPAKCAELFKALTDNTVDDFLKANPKIKLGGLNSVH